ncbi:MAG TPA: hypothetical protein VG870_13805 [Chitinophagaceae bacterium]|nr:hypothetical protein [Chitinophagaceae bacterium]
MATKFPLKHSARLILVLAVLLVLDPGPGLAQSLTAADRRRLEQTEDSLKVLAKTLIVDSLEASRMRADSQFIRTLVRALQVRNSFSYPFDSVLGVSHLYAPDSTFRIFSWNLSYDDYYSRQRGAIQLRTRDGSLRLLPLRDVSEFTASPMDSVRTRNNWIGAVYYRIIETQFNGKRFYTLFGYDENSAMTNKKWIEVMHFNDQQEPVFGGPYFSFAQDSLPRPTQYRFSIEYKKAASTTMNYNGDLNMILYDHLISETNEPEKRFTYVPDGDYEGFRWENGKWMHVDKVFTYKLQDGQAPVGDPLLDPKGNRDEKKLQDKSDRNRQHQ